MKILRIILLTFISFFLIACGSGKTEQNEDLVNLVIITHFAGRDGVINESESAYLNYLIERHGITESQVKDMKKLESASIYQIMRVFDEIVEVMKADGEVTLNEKATLFSISADTNNLEKDKALGIFENIDADVEEEMFTMKSLMLLYTETCTGTDSDQEFGHSLWKYIKQWGRFNVGQVYAVRDALRGKNNIKITVPSDINRKMRVVDSVVGFIKSDGEVTEKEKEFLIKLASDLKVDKEKVLAKLRCNGNPTFLHLEM